MDIAAAGLVNAVLEGETAKDFLRRKGVGVVPLDREYSLGFSISINSEHSIEHAAYHYAIPLDDAAWEQLNKDIRRLELNTETLLNSNGVRCRNEGHADNDLIGSAWVRPKTPGWDIVKHYFETDGQSLMGALAVHSELKGDLAGGISRIGKQLLDVTVRFFNAQEIEKYFDI